MNLSARSNSGIVIAIALILGLFLLALASAYLDYVHRDSQQQLQSNLNAQAECLARSGVEYFCYNNYPSRDTDETVGFAPGTRLKVTVSKGRLFEILVTPGGGCESTGLVENAMGAVQASRTLVVPDDPGATLPVPYNHYDKGL